MSMSIAKADVLGLLAGICAWVGGKPEGKTNEAIYVKEKTCRFE